MAWISESARLVCVVAGILFWTPLCISGSKSLLIKSLIPALTIACTGLFLLIGGRFHVLDITVCLLLLSSIYVFSISLYRVTGICRIGAVSLSIHAVAGGIMFASLFLWTPLFPDFLTRLLLLINIPTAVFGSLEINILRSIYYDKLPLSEVFVVLPRWWKYLLFYGIGALLLQMVYVITIRQRMEKEVNK